MKKAILVALMTITAILLVSCSKESSPDPIEETEAYIDLWESYEFDQMYKRLTEDTKNTVDPEDFIDRYEKIYEDLEIDNLSIEMGELDSDTIKEFIEKKEALIPIEVTMDSFAGPINFEHDLSLILNTADESNDEDAQWLFNWDTTFIFPELVEDSKIRIETVKPRRGDILDRNRMPLAINGGAYEVGIVPINMQDEQSEINQLSNILNVSTSSIEKKLDASWVEPEHFVPIRQISDQDESKINQLRNIPGVSLDETEGRHYPLGPAAAHLVGYVGMVTAEDLEEDDNKHLTEEDQIGKAGLEKKFDKVLRGEEGKKIIIIDEFDRETVLAEDEVKHGENVHLTLDVELQQTMFDSFDDKSGTGVALHPTNGDLLALVSYPAYDPNDFTYGVSEAKWEALSNDQQQPMFNRFNATFAPGSVIKPITSVIGLNDGAITYDEGIEINGLHWSKDEWKDVKITRVSTSNKPVTLEDALIRSDNIYFAMKSLDIGGKSFVSGLKDLGFDDKLPIDLNINPSHISNSGDLNDEVLLANSSYGQGEIEMSAFHLALLYTMFLNDGHVIEPKLYLDDAKPSYWLKDVISKEDADQINDILRKVVTEGTAKAAQDKSLEIAGKTGTAELKQSYDEDGQSNGWFVGYEQKDQDILIAMLVEDVQGEGSSAATKAVKKVMKTYKK